MKKYQTYNRLPNFKLRLICYWDLEEFYRVDDNNGFFCIGYLLTAHAAAVFYLTCIIVYDTNYIQMVGMT